MKFLAMFLPSEPESSKHATQVSANYVTVMNKNSPFRAPYNLLEGFEKAQ